MDVPVSRRRFLELGGAACLACGIRHFTTFAVYVNGEYVQAFGPESLDCIRAYADILKNGVGARL